MLPAVEKIDETVGLRAVPNKLPCDLVFLHVINSCNPDRSTRRLNLTRQTLEHGGLASPVSAKNHHALVPPRHEADAGHCCLAALVLKQVAHHHRL